MTKYFFDFLKNIFAFLTKNQNSAKKWMHDALFYGSLIAYRNVDGAMSQLFDEDNVKV